MRTSSQPLSAVIWDAPGVLSGGIDGWMRDRLEHLSDRGVLLAAMGGPAPAEAGIERVFGGPPGAEAFAEAVAALGLEAGSVLYVGASGAEVNAAAKAGLRTFLYSRLGRDMLRRRLET